MKKSFIVKTSNGPVRGHEIKSNETGGKFCSFQGIPYAKPPLGPLRFKVSILQYLFQSHVTYHVCLLVSVLPYQFFRQPPEPVEPWSEVRDCREEGNVCIQNHMYLRDLRGSEDCLYLNVYTPQVIILLITHGRYYQIIT